MLTSLILVFGFFLAFRLGFANCYEEAATVDELEAELDDLDTRFYLERLHGLRVALCTDVYHSLDRVENEERRLDQSKECEGLDDPRESLLDCRDDITIIYVRARSIHPDELKNHSVEGNHG